MTSIDVTELLFKMREMLNNPELNKFVDLTSYESRAKLEDVKFCFDMLLKEFCSDE